MGVRLPRLMDASFAEIARLRPTKESVTLCLTPLSTATLTLPEGEPLVSVRQWVELYGAAGSLGYFRVANEGTGYGKEQRVTLKHGIVTLADECAPGGTELTGTKRAILAALLSYQSTVRWQLGAAPDTGSHTIKLSKGSVLQAMLSALKLFDGYALTYDFTTSPWTLGLAALSSTPECECRLSRNITGVTISRDDGELCTRAYDSHLAGGYLDADTATTWGIIGKDLGLPEDAIDSEVLAYAQEFLELHKNPTVSIEVDAVELAQQTGEALDAFSIGKLCRVALPDYNTTVNERLISIRYDDLITRPDRARISLCNVVRDLSTDLARLETATDKLETETVSQGSSLRGLGGRVASDKEEATTLFAELESEILLRAWATDVNALGERMRLAEIDINGAEAAIGLHTSVLNEHEQLISAAEIDIDGLNAEIQLRVEKDGVVSSINQTPESIRINAAKINLEGYVTASQLNAKFATIDGMSVNSFSVGSLGCTSGVFSQLSANSSFTFQLSPVSKKAITVLTSLTPASTENITLLVV